MKIVVYTAIFGNIDRLWSVCPTSFEEDAEFVAITDKPLHEVGLWGGDKPTAINDGPAIPQWEQRCIPGWKEWGSARRAARRIKALPHHYFPNADIWIWLDGNVRLLIPPSQAVERWLKGDLAIFKHPDRTCLYLEAAFCARVGKDSREVLDRQVKGYDEQGMPRHYGLAETRCVIRRNTDIIRDFNEQWWGELSTKSVRDQVSLPFICWGMGLQWDVIPGRAWVKNTSPWFWFRKHQRG